LSHASSAELYYSKQWESTAILALTFAIVKYLPRQTQNGMRATSTQTLGAYLQQISILSLKELLHGIININSLGFFLAAS
jgi:hypothetical protein